MGDGAAGGGDGAAGGFDGDGTGGGDANAGGALDGGGDGTAGDGTGDGTAGGDGGGGTTTPPGGDVAPLQTLRIGGKVVTVAPRIRLVPLTPPPRGVVVPPPPVVVVDDDLRAAAPGTRAKAPGAAAPAARTTRSRRGIGAFNQACVLLFFHTKGKYFLFVKLDRDFVLHRKFIPRLMPALPKLHVIIFCYEGIEGLSLL